MSGHEPFGLKLRASRSDIEAVVDEMAALPPSDDGSILYIVAGIPKPIADIETILCNFTLDDQLWRIHASFKPNEQDPYGSATRSRYQELKKLLSRRYGAGKETDFTAEYYTDNSWVLGLYSGENVLSVIFEADDLLVHLFAFATDSDTSKVVLAYECTSLGEIVTQAREAKEFDAL